MFAGMLRPIFPFYQVKRVFRACPGDLVSERSKFPKLIETVNNMRAHSLGFHPEAVGWERVIPSFGRPQELINRELELADLVVVLFWNRIGSPASKESSKTRNPRTHSDAQVSQIAASIVEFGFNAPILVDSSAGVIAGHRRLQAARKLGLAEGPVIVLDHLAESQKRAYIIAYNKLALNSGWDEELLAAELAELERAGRDLALVGFSDDELRELLHADTGSPAADSEEIPPVPINPVTRPGDLWTIGRHRLLCGDCRDRAAAVWLFAGSRANVVITSPPYAKQREYDAFSGFQPCCPHSM